MRRRRLLDPSGFTLIELLVSLSLAVGIAGGAYVCLQIGLESRKTCEVRMDMIQSARVALNLMTSDLESACVFSKKYEFVGMDRVLGEMEADNLDFATHNHRPRAPGEGDLCEVSYFVDRSPETGELGLFRRRDPSPDEDPLDGGTREEIAAGVVLFRLEYFDGYDWYDSWGVEGDIPKGRTDSAWSSYNLGGLPEAVRITLGLREATEPGAEPGRRSQASKVEKSAEGGPAPPGPQAPLLFQTVVRLNLAARASSGSYGSQTPTPSTGEGVGEAKEGESQ